MNNRTIDFMIDSASRPDLLEETATSLLKHVKFSGTIRWFFHEAVMYAEASNKCLDFASRFFGDITVTNPPMGEGASISKILRKCKSKYFIHWEDDHVLLRDLDLDYCYNLFENHTSINQIAFNKRNTMTSCSGWRKENFKFGTETLAVCPHWRISPAMWRLSFILPRWIWYDQKVEGSGHNFHWEINAVLQEQFKDNKTTEAVASKMGTFYLGPILEPAYVKHTGRDRSGRKS